MQIIYKTRIKEMIYSPIATSKDLVEKIKTAHITYNYFYTTYVLKEEEKYKENLDYEYNLLKKYIPFYDFINEEWDDDELDKLLEIRKLSSILNKSYECVNKLKNRYELIDDDIKEIMEKYNIK